ncbi:hypothetical protein DCC62_17340 [candidate division KSB1 bacterium]|nr:MAG: hypothetical protein DCC62_17340 [candidate division KSB1 bacterium]
MNNWKTVKLGDVLRRADRFEEKDELTEYRFAGTFSFGRGIFVGETKSGSTFRLPKIQRVKSGDFIYCKIMAWEGAFGVAPPDVDGCVLSGAFVVYEIDKELLDPKYLDYYFKIKSVWKQIGSQSTGTNVRRRSLHPDQFEIAEIPLPPLSEQRRIVAKIEQLAAKIEEARGLREHNGEIAGKFLGTLSTNLFKTITTPHSIIPFGKTVSFRNDLIRPVDGKTGELRFIGLQHIESHTGKRIGEDRLLAEELTGRKFKFSPNEIVYGYLRPYLNKVWIADCEGFCSVDQYVLRPKLEIVETQYLAYFMRSNAFLYQAIELTHNLILPRLRTALLQSINIPLPPLAEQRRIVAYLDSLQAQVDRLKVLQAQTAAELEALLPAILDRAFKGEL